MSDEAPCIYADCRNLTAALRTKLAAAEALLRRWLYNIDTNGLAWRSTAEAMNDTRAYLNGATPQSPTCAKGGE